MYRITSQAGTVPLWPRVFTLAAAFEGVATLDFLQDPTKLTNALYQTWSWQRYDGVFAYHDQNLVAEAAGVPVAWDGARFQLNGAGTARLAAADAVLKGGRMPVALESARRLAAQLRGEAGLAVLLPGPFRLAEQLAGGIPGPEVLESAGSILQACARAFLAAGVDLLWISETGPAATPQESFKVMANLANFYRKGLVVERVGGLAGVRDLLAAGCWGAVVDATLAAPGPAAALLTDWPPEKGLGLALPVSATGPDAGLPALGARLGPKLPTGAFWTTADEIHGWNAEQLGELRDMLTGLP